MGFLVLQEGYETNSNLKDSSYATRSYRRSPGWRELCEPIIESVWEFGANQRQITMKNLKARTDKEANEILALNQAKTDQILEAQTKELVSTSARLKASEAQSAEIQAANIEMRAENIEMKARVARLEAFMLGQSASGTQA